MAAWCRLPRARAVQSRRGHGTGRRAAQDWECDPPPEVGPQLAIRQVLCLSPIQDGTHLMIKWQTRERT